MRSITLLLASALLAAFISSALPGTQALQYPPPPPSTPGKPVNACRVAYAKLVGNPFLTFEDALSERWCFYQCVASATNWYSYDQEINECLCFLYDQVTDVSTIPKGVVPSFGYRVYGNIEKCFPFCSVKVNNCARCQTKAGGTFCIKPPIPQGLNRPRCCCRPPSRPLIRKGKLAGCTKTGRVDLEVSAPHSMAYELERTGVVKDLSPFFQLVTFDAVTTRNMSSTP